MIGEIVGSALGIGGAIFGGLKASQAMKKAKQGLAKQKADNYNWFERRYNEDATQRADAQRIMTKMQEAMRNRDRAAAGRAAVMGATDESVAAEKAANAEAMADAASQIAVAGDRRKDAAEEQYMQTQRNIEAQQNQMEVNKANAITQAIGGVAQAAGNLINL